MNTKSVSKKPQGNAVLHGVSGSFFTKTFRKIPIRISKWHEGNVKGWRAEIADSYEDYKTSKYNDINFEDITFHFRHDVETHELDNLVFYLRKDAIKAAKIVNEKYLNNKAKLWFF